MIDRDDLADDPVLADPVQRNARVEELYGLIAEAMPARTTREWVADLLAADILFGEMLSPEDLVTDRHLEAVGMFNIVEHPTEGPIRLIGFPVQSSAGVTSVARLPPTLGQHSREILGELGMPQDAIDRLVRAGNVIDGALPT
jgi:crotonobetainyl-CoA:carnitine CoA-transferase CaiB-like acyl-CoA transferase